MKTVITLISICILLPLVCANGGRVKTIDGKQMPKDSVAVLYLTEQIGKRFADSILFVSVIKLDTITVSEILHGVKDDYSIVESPNTNPHDWNFDKAYYEFAESYQVRKVHLIPGKHTLTLRGLARLSTKKGDDIFFTTPFQLSAQFKAKHTYHLKIRFEKPIWHITIEDRTAKKAEAVATISITSK